MKQTKAMSSFLTEAMNMLNAAMHLSGNELYHYNMRPMLEGMKRVLNTLDDRQKAGTMELLVDTLLEEEGIAEAELLAFSEGPDPDDELEWSKEVIHPDAIFRTSGLFGEDDLAYKIAETLGWLDMTVEVVAPAVEAIVNNYKGVPCEILDLTGESIFGLLLGSDDVTWEDMKTFLSLRGEIESEMAAGHSYQEAIDEWFK